MRSTTVFMALLSSSSLRFLLPKLMDLQFGFLHQTYIFNGPLHEFTDVTQSFFNIVWYVALPPKAQPASIMYPAQLVPVSTGEAASDMLTYIVHGKALQYTLPNGSQLYLGHYAETVLAYSLWHAVHDVTFGGLATKLGATILAGDCPLFGHKASEHLDSTRKRFELL
ncbi:hypothetical protein B0H19DRAFT_1061437 [Mycena capillaripes]|nr:hypothetical protein B0H19DRAFT_1061437 [Mycena capillaripes]